MKLGFLLLLPLLFGARPSTPPAVRVRFSPLTKAAYLQAGKGCVKTKPRITFPLKKVHGRIVIPTAKGREVFTDITIDDAAIAKGHGEDESTTYTYLGYLKDFHSHLIQAQLYEITEWLLIDDNGKHFELWGEPLFSPDMKHIASSCTGIEYGGGQPNIIQLLGLQNGALREVWSLEPKTWEPYGLCWTSNNSLTLSRAMWTGKNIGNTFTYSRMTIN
jgi:hypothetical protein